MWGSGHTDMAGTMWNQGIAIMSIRIPVNPADSLRISPVDFTDVAKKKATIHTFMVCERSGAFNTLETPIKFINVEFEGVATILMSYLSMGKPKIGMRVIPIFKTVDPTYTITDLSWVPEGVPETNLPEGFTYG